jgi:hypothetical protein
MSRPTISASEVERLLRQAGVAGDTQGGNNRRPRRKRSLRRRAATVLLTVLVCASAVVALALYTSIGTVGEPVIPPKTLPSVPTPAAADPRIGIVEAFRAPAQAATVPIGWERIQFSWKELQKKGPDSWDLFATNHDAQIDHEIKLGRQVVGLLINTPDWAAANPAMHGSSPPKGLYLPYDDPHNYWGHFVGMVAKRYAGRVDDWIIWNEVNIPSGQWKTWGGTAADYVQLVKVAYLAAKAANPAARIVLAGDPYWYDHGALFDELLRTVAADPSAASHDDYFDVVNLHLYSRPTDMIKVVGWYRAQMRKAGITKPIWISETNAIPYDDSVRLYPKGGFLATLDNQASYIIQAFALDLALGVQRFEVNRMVDGADFKAGGEPFGLIRNDGTARPALAAYRTAATLFDGVTSGTIGFNSATGVYTVKLKKPGAQVTVLWDQHPTAASRAVPAPGKTRFYDKFGQPLTFTVRHGAATIKLDGATGNTNSSDRSDYVIGGNPVIVVQPA